MVTDIPVGSPIYYEEFFGPVVTVYKVSSDEEGLEAGMTGVNQSAPETESMPFGGVKRSGYGRELGPPGMDEFVNKRLYSVKKRVTGLPGSRGRMSPVYLLAVTTVRPAVLRTASSSGSMSLKSKSVMVPTF